MTSLFGPRVSERIQNVWWSNRGSIQIYTQRIILAHVVENTIWITSRKAMSGRYQDDL